MKSSSYYTRRALACAELGWWSANDIGYPQDQKPNTQAHRQPDAQREVVR